VTAAPLQLAYDDLPAGSDIRREYAADGSVRITVPASEIPAPVRRAAAHRALVSGAVLAAPVLAFALLLFAHAVRTNRVSGVPLAWAVAFFGVFCVAMAGLIAWVRYGVLVETAQAARRQATLIHASTSRVMVETTGPFGTVGYDLPRDRLIWIGVGRGSLTSGRGVTYRVRYVTLRAAASRPIHLLPGRDDLELHWVAATLTRATGVPPPTMDESSRRYG
jgi:hypothetical protein